MLRTNPGSVCAVALSSMLCLPSLLILAHPNLFFIMLFQSVVFPEQYSLYPASPRAGSDKSCAVPNPKAPYEFPNKSHEITESSASHGHIPGNILSPRNQVFPCRGNFLSLRWRVILECIAAKWSSDRNKIEKELSKFGTSNSVFVGHTGRRSVNTDQKLFIVKSFNDENVLNFIHYALYLRVSGYEVHLRNCFGCNKLVV